MSRGRLRDFHTALTLQSLFPLGCSGQRAPLSVTAWLYEDGNHTRLGLSDEAHTGAHGIRFSVATGINESGLVAGYSLRNIEGTEPWRCIPMQTSDCSPNTTWLYDPVGDETIVLIGNGVRAGRQAQDSTG